MTTYEEIDTLHSELLQYLFEIPNIVEIPLCFGYSEEPEKRRALLEKMHVLGYHLEGALQELCMDATYNPDGDKYQAVPQIRGVVRGNPPVPLLEHRYITVSVCGVNIKVTFTLFSGVYGLSPNVPIVSGLALHRMRDIIIEEVIEYHMEELRCTTLQMLIIVLRKIEELIRERMPHILQCTNCHYIDKSIMYCGMGLTVFTPNCSKHHCSKHLLTF